MDYNSFSKPKMVANAVGAVICYILFAYELHGRIQDHSSITSSLLFLYFAVNCTFRVISFARLKRKKKSLTDEKALLKAEHRQGLVLNIFNNATAALLLLSAPSDDACTSIMVGKKASSDGSVMTAHCCDSYYRTYVTIEPRKTFKPGETEPYFFNVLHKEEPWDPRGVYETGRIVPPALQTYRFVNTAYPCMNEKQLAIGETTYDI